ncbi:hypothetical protein FIBSPDRAFT_982419 [Athelia psychrophila]|uniref:Uncharacterized protein n=1 Tax=Athelia psychrophila TaxID=1759441 RepID=A0A166TB95_9AGAM|nr:hypothetical protein FIBSPDRAFT_982419 [Fibularhizoctonia sp. CBS 109695]
MMIMIHDSHMLSVTVPRQPVAVRLIKVIIRRELGTGCNPARYSHVRQDQESGPRNQASGIKNQELRIRNQEVSGDPGCGMLEAVRRRRLGEREKARKDARCVRSRVVYARFFPGFPTRLSALVGSTSERDRLPLHESLTEAPTPEAEAVAAAKLPRHAASVAALGVWRSSRVKRQEARQRKQPALYVPVRSSSERTDTEPLHVAPTRSLDLRGGGTGH